MNKFFWTQDAEPEEQGSFSNVESKHTYDNVSDLGRAEATRNAASAGDVVVELDERIDGSDRGVSMDQRHNLYYAEEDDQGSQSPRKYGPGR